MPEFPEPPAPLSLRRAGLLFLRVGNLTFGGGDPTIAVLQRELVQQRGWLTPEQFGLAFSLGRMTPGTTILAFCAAVGWMMLGAAGSVVVVLAITVPSSVLVVVLTQAMEAFASNRIASATVGAMLAGSVGMMGAAAWLLVRPHLSRRGRWIAIAVTMIAFLCINREWLSPIQVLGVAALAGFLLPERPE